MDAQKKRLLIITLFGLAAIGAVVLLTDPAMSPFMSSVMTPTSPGPTVAIAPAPPVVAPGSPINNKTPVMPEGAQLAGQPLRDIFAPPAEYARTLFSAMKPELTNGARPFSTGPTPVLTGIIAGDQSKVAILRQGAISRSYRVGESAGAFRVLAISGNTVVLSGPSGNIVLKMGL